MGTAGHTASPVVLGVSLPLALSEHVGRASSCQNPGSAQTGTTVSLFIRTLRTEGRRPSTEFGVQGRKPSGLELSLRLSGQYAE